MIVLVDTNVLLDVLIRREPHYRASAYVWTLAERGDITAFISAISFNNIYYIVRKAESKTKAEKVLKLLRDTFDSVAPDAKIINQASTQLAMISRMPSNSILPFELEPMF